MKKLLLAVTLLFGCSAALAQYVPSGPVVDSVRKAVATAVVDNQTYNYTAAPCSVPKLYYRVIAGHQYLVSEVLCQTAIIVDNDPSHVDQFGNPCTAINICSIGQFALMFDTPQGSSFPFVTIWLSDENGQNQTAYLLNSTGTLNGGGTATFQGSDRAVNWTTFTQVGRCYKGTCQKVTNIIGTISLD
jgi:hypothetical protein